MKITLAKAARLPEPAPDFLMTLPLFINVRGSLVNISQCASVFTDEEVLVFSVTPDADMDDYRFEYKTTAEAAAALGQVQDILAAKNMFLGTIN